jgi:hypothetical protein
MTSSGKYIVILILMLRIYGIDTFMIAMNRRCVVGFYKNVLRTTGMQNDIKSQHCELRAFSIEENDIYPDDDESDELSDEELEATVGNWDEKIARFNTIQLTGRVGNTPEARYFDDGKVVVNLSLASRRKYHGMERKVNNIKIGEEETDWYGLEIWVR